MNFVFPWFLTALLALAIPVIIHLFYFRKFKKVYFSNTRFLKEVKEEKSTIEKIKKRWILLTRLLALFFLVLAFVQPFLSTKNNEQHKGTSAVCIYVDNSYSMGLKNSGETLLSIAKVKAKEIAQSFTNTDKFALLTNDFDGTHQRWMFKQDFLDAVDKIALSPSVKTNREIASKQATLFKTVGAANKLGFILSDFQLNALSTIADTTFSIYLLPINANNEKNIYIDTCWFEQPIFTTNAGNKLLMRIRNSGTTAAEKVRVSLKINDAVKAIDDISIPAEGTLVDSFNFTITQPGWQRGEISFNDYPITFDDQFYFAFNVQQQEKVLSIEAAETPVNISSVFINDAHFSFNKSDVGQIDYSTFKQYSLIILNQLPDISSGLSASLSEYLKKGGNVYIIPSVQANIQSYNTFLSTNNIGTLGALQNQAGEVTHINLKEDVFKGVFKQLPKNMEMPKFNKYYPINAGQSASIREILSTNNNQPFVAKFDAGKGYLYLQTVPLNSAFSDIASKALFAPMVYNFAVFKRNNQPLYYIIGKDNLIEIDNPTENSTNSDNLYKLSNGKYAFIPENRTVGNTTILRVNTTLPMAGQYNIEHNTNKNVAVVAFNFDRSESVLKFADKALLKQTFNQKNQLIVDNTQANISAVVKQIKDGILFWKVCVILSLLFLLTEIILIRFWK